MIGGYLIILLLLSVYDWILKEYPIRPNKTTSEECIQHPVHHEEAVNALRLFSQLPQSEQAAIKESLESNLISMEQWLMHLSRSDYHMLCIGESHEEFTRNFLAIEETDEQQEEQCGHSNSRDQSIAHNFWDFFQQGKRNIILFGALHCTNDSNWLFLNLHSQASLHLKDRMLNVWVLGEHQNGPLEAFAYFLDEIGIEKNTLLSPTLIRFIPVSTSCINY